MWGGGEADVGGGVVYTMHMKLHCGLLCKDRTEAMSGDAVTFPGAGWRQPTGEWDLAQVFDSPREVQVSLRSGCPVAGLCAEVH